MPAPLTPPAGLGWTAPYVGLPCRDHGRDRTGCDCWGLVVLVFAEVLGQAVPAYSETYATAEELAEIEAAITGNRAASPFAEVARTDAPRAFDLALFRLGRHESHVGIVADPARRLMLHMIWGERSVLARWDVPAWRSRLVGFYRHAGFAEVAA